MVWQTPAPLSPSETVPNASVAYLFRWMVSGEGEAPSAPQEEDSEGELGGRGSGAGGEIGQSGAGGEVG